MPRRRGLVLPSFRSEEEEFEFWKTHDVEDYLTGEVVPLEEALRPPKKPRRKRPSGEATSARPTTTKRARKVPA